MRRLTVILAALILAFNAHTAAAWSRPGHMVVAAIAYDDLMAHDPQIVATIDEIMAKHPDHAVFEVAGGPRSDTRARKVFLEMARWADDIRGTPFDHPTWHYAGRPVIDKRSPPSPPPPDAASGAAMEAYALNLRVAGFKGASPAERAVALCWVFHLVGDIHQPLHMADQYTATLPEGDQGGNLQFVRDPRSGVFLNLHSFWDGIVRGNGDAAEAIERGANLAARYPRSQFKQLKKAAPTAADTATWAKESYDIAQKVAYRGDLVTGPTQQEGKPLTKAYVLEATTAGERQVVLAGYRLADVLRSIFP